MRKGAWSWLQLAGLAADAAPATATIAMAAMRLLNVLHLLAHLLDEDLELDGNPRHLVRDGLGSERIRLAVELLAEEIEPLADGAALVQHALELADMGGEAAQLLLHIDARGVEHDLLLDTLV